jgi:hypothetical protein
MGVQGVKGAWRGAALGALAVLLALAGTPASAEGTRRALLIGINDYQAFPNLRGALNDVELLGGVLESRFGFAPEHVRRLTDAQATRAGILAALAALAREAGPEDVVYVHYSGHGSQVEDVDGDEGADGMDETLVPHDGRTEGVPDITDDELAAALASLPAGRAVVVLDSCHSGTATRGGVAVHTRSVPPDRRLELYARAGTTTRGEIPLLEERHVLLSATPPHQSALDGPVDGRPYGLFSFSLGRSLASLPTGTPAREVLVGSMKELARAKEQLGIANVPEPQLEGPAARLAQPLFPTSRGAGAPAGPPRLAFARVEPGADAAQVALLGGAALGGGVGSLWALYPPEETEFPPGGALAEAEVTGLRGDDALARLGPTSATIAPGARAVLISPPAPPAGLAIQWRADGSERAARTLEALRKQLPALELVEPGAFARFVVDAGEAGFRVFGADGVSKVGTVPADEPERAAGKLATILGRSITAAELLAIDNPSSALRLGIEVVRPGLRGLTLVPAGGTAPVYRIRRGDEPRTLENSLQLRLEASAACYLTITHVDPGGAVQTLFPNPLSEARGYVPEGRIEAKSAVLVPDSIAPGNQAGFYLDYAPPVGSDTIRAFCSTDLATARALRSQLAGIGSRGGDASLQGLRGLRGRAARVVSRGVQLVAAEEESVPAPPGEAPPPSPPAPPAGGGADWTATSVVIEVTEG